MPVGDVLEWFGAGCLTVAAYMWSGTVLALGVAGVALIYFAQCYDTKLALPRRRHRNSTDLDGDAIWRCSKCGGEHYLGLQAGHACRVEA